MKSKFSSDLLLQQVATSGVHYGFYHTDPHLPPPGPQVWERSEQAYNRPRAAGTQISWIALSISSISQQSEGYRSGHVSVE